MFFGNSNKAQAPAMAPAGTAPSANTIFEAGAADFEAKVLLASMQRPVIAYFTAPWCGPCKQLGPVLEVAVNAVGGAVSMAKINIDNNQELAAALRIQSVPTVYAFFQGRPVDAFQGAVPESQIKAFIAKLLQLAKQAMPGALDIPEALKAAAQAMADSDLATAQGIYVQILQQDDKNAPAYAGMVRVMIAAGQVEQARGFLDGLPPEIKKTSAYSEAKTALELAEAKPASPLTALLAAVQAAPDDHQARIDLALGQFSSDQREAAVETLLESIRRNRMWNEETARKQLVKFFEAMGHGDPLTIEARKKLSAILFS